MTLDAWRWKDPARHVRFERETNPCFGCAFLSKLFDRKFCERGMDMKKKCSSYRKQAG